MIALSASTLVISQVKKSISKFLTIYLFYFEILQIFLILDTDNLLLLIY